MSSDGSRAGMGGWFAGPKGENADRFAGIVRRILEDHIYWRRNYFPSDGNVLSSSSNEARERFFDEFDDRLNELLATLKADFPFHSPRYIAHMIAEQTLPSIAGYFAGMLYNPNNVTAEAAPVTVKLELEASMMICRMLGYGDTSWGHLTSGGTVANIEALWVARTARFLPHVMRDVAKSVLPEHRVAKMNDRQLLAMTPDEALACMGEVMRDQPPSAWLSAFRESPYNIVERGVSAVYDKADTELVLIVPETAHYCLPKTADLLGLGRDGLVYVEVDADFCVRIDALDSALDAVEREGKTPLAVVSVVGSTEEGAIDPLDEVLALRSGRLQQGKPAFWLHGDAAYGGYLKTITIPERIGLGEPTTHTSVNGRELDLELSLPVRSVCDALEALGGCDSLAIDPHKLGYVPYPAGAVCFKNDLVKPIARQDAPYIADPIADVESERQSPDVGVYVLEGSKPGFVAAGVWLSHSLIPLDSSGHGALMQDTVRNGAELYSLLVQYPELSGGSRFEVVPLCQPGSNIVCWLFRSTGGHHSLASLNEFNKRIYDRFTIEGDERRSVYTQRFFVSRTRIMPEQYSVGSVQGLLERLGVSESDYREHGVFFLRSVVMNPWYAEAKERGRYYLAEFVEELYSAASDVAAGMDTVL